MDELIKINYKNGQKLVSARELYLGLGLNKAAWSRWYKSNIQENEYFTQENGDWIGVQHDVEGNEVQDFAITLDFAKHIAMMARTEKSHQYRNYFIQCEKIAKSPTRELSAMDQLRLQYQVLEEQQEAIQDINKRIDNLANTITVDHGQEKDIQAKVRRRVSEVMKNAYNNKTLRRKVYSFIWEDVKAYFNVASYHNILKDDYKKCINYIGEIKLQGSLLREVEEEEEQ